MQLAELEIHHVLGAYPIYIGEAIIDKPRLASHIVGQQVLIVTNETIAKLYLKYLKQFLTDYVCHEIILPDGEAYKNLTEWQKIINYLAEHSFHRDATIIALGGGVIGDIAGFAAATYHRGIAFIQIPSSLLAQVDASIGGKTAINLASGKNLIGAFHQPNAVIIDISLLSTLPDREYISGIAEIIKAALIHDAIFFEWLENNINDLLTRKSDTLQYAIKNSCQIKATIVEADERESGQRALLNFGHTVGHAIEHLLGYGHWLHGEAVAVGMILATKLSLNMGYISAEEAHRVSTLVRKTGLPIKLPERISANQLLETMQRDKKVLTNNLRFVLLKKIGEGIIENKVAKDRLLSILSMD